ncbi:hypothetical protein JAAARDRAFT_209187 [Jaapia argillacea MUCL 33604]|uniref:AIG1-type G domain-containing protein n=1 Tax=Jaapia argillacea MUCL 33604 TaxID=933084 RepID=A0A067PKU8_9AGAM|nr:hypothetical protein JAAARDRAFT_209187 [Jaapia argillacea MUCL 33604]
MIPSVSHTLFTPSLTKMTSLYPSDTTSTLTLRGTDDRDYYKYSALLSLRIQFHHNDRAIQFEDTIPVANVLVFGESGCGKSSVVNMLDDSVNAPIGSTAEGCTFETQKYTIYTEHTTLNVFDTIGLNEGREGTVPTAKAIQDLYALVRNMENGVHLLVYVIRGPRVTETTRVNYRIFYEAFCQRQVPIVAVVTGLENEVPIDSWWHVNLRTIRRYGLDFAGHACITATRGKTGGNGVRVFEEEYEQSKTKVRELVFTSCSSAPWKMEPLGWLQATLKSIYNILLPTLGLKPKTLSRPLLEALVTSKALTDSEARKVANKFERDLRKLK